MREADAGVRLRSPPISVARVPWRTNPSAPADVAVISSHHHPDTAERPERLTAHDYRHRRSNGT